MGLKRPVLAQPRQPRHCLGWMGQAHQGMNADLLFLFMKDRRKERHTTPAHDDSIFATSEGSRPVRELTHQSHLTDALSRLPYSSLNHRHVLMNLFFHLGLGSSKVQTPHQPLRTHGIRQHRHHLPRRFSLRFRRKGRYYYAVGLERGQALVLSRGR